MKKLLTVFCLLPLMGACTRVSVGSFSAADSGEAAGRIVNSNDNIKEERSLGRLEDIDQSIQDSLARLDAALDPNSQTDPANLDKLVQGDEIDPALKNDPYLLRQAQIDQKFDDKNRDLINDELSGNLDSVSKNTGLNPDNFDNRNLKQTAEIDQKLDQKAVSSVEGDEQEGDSDRTEIEKGASENTNSDPLPSL
jgi:hypothetical protein